MNITSTSFPQIKTYETYSKNLKEYYKSPDLVFQVFTGCATALRLAIHNAPKLFANFNSVKLLTLLESPNYFSLFSLFCIPTNLFYPITADTINKNELLRNIRDQLRPLEPPTGILSTDVSTIDLAHEQLDNYRKKTLLFNAFFKEVIDQQIGIIRLNNEAYRNEDDLRVILKAGIVRSLQKGMKGFNSEYDSITNSYTIRKSDDPLISFDLSFIALQNSNFKIPYYKSSLDKWITNVGFGLVDIQLSLMALHEWKVLNIAKLGISELTLRITLVATFTFKFHEACYKLWNHSIKLKDERLSPEEIAQIQKKITQIKWDLLGSGADLLSNTVALLNHVKWIQASTNVIYGGILLARIVNAYRIMKGY